MNPNLARESRSFVFLRVSSARDAGRLWALAGGAVFGCATLALGLCLAVLSSGPDERPWTLIVLLVVFGASIAFVCGWDLAQSVGLLPLAVLAPVSEGVRVVAITAPLSPLLIAHGGAVTVRSEAYEARYWRGGLSGWATMPRHRWILESSEVTLRWARPDPISKGGTRAAWVEALRSLGLDASAR